MSAVFAELAVFHCLLHTIMSVLVVNMTELKNVIKIPLFALNCK